MEGVPTTKGSLTPEEAIQVWLLRWNGAKQNAIAQKFGVNQARVNDVLQEKKHVGSKAIALSRRNKAA